MNKKELLHAARVIMDQNHPFTMNHFVRLLSIKAKNFAEPSEIRDVCRTVRATYVAQIRRRFVKYRLIQDLKKKYPACIAAIERYEKTARL